MRLHPFFVRGTMNKKQIQEGFAQFGAEISFDADTDLEQFKRGEPMTWAELRALPENGVVWLWIYYKESVRADGAYRVTRTKGGDFFFDDGSSFAADLDDKGEDNDVVDVEDEDCEAITRLYKVSL